MSRFFVGLWLAWLARLPNERAARRSRDVVVVRLTISNGEEKNFFFAFSHLPFLTSCPLPVNSVLSVPKKSGRPSKKRGAEVAWNDGGEEFDLFGESGAFDTYWENPLEHEKMLDLLDIQSCLPIPDISPLPQPDFLLSILLSNAGASAFIARAVDIAASIGLQLEGNLWALVHHQATHFENCDMWQMLMHSVVVAHSPQVSRIALGKNLAGLITENDIASGAEFFKCVLQSALAQCSIGTILMNHLVIRSNGERVSLRSSYVFYDEHGKGRFQFVVGGGEGATLKHLPVIGNVVPAPKATSVLISTLSVE